MPVGSVGLEEWAKVQLVDHIQDEPGQVVGGQPVTDIGWEQEHLVTVAGTEVVGHGRSYSIGLLCCRLQPRFRQPFPQPQAREGQARSPTGLLGRWAGAPTYPPDLPPS
jgi:hypothetical protein